MSKKITSSLSHEQRKFLKSDGESVVFRDLVAEQASGAEGLNLRAKLSRARTEVKPTADGGAEVSVYYPFDDNGTPTDGSLYIVDRFRFNPQGQLLASEAGQVYGGYFAREVLYNGQGDKGFWKGTLESYQKALVNYESSSVDSEEASRRRVLYANYAMQVGGGYVRPLNSEVEEKLGELRAEYISDIDSALMERGYQVDLSDPKSTYLYVPRRTKMGGDLVELCVVVAVKSSDPQVQGRAYLRDSFVFSVADPSRLLGFERSLEADPANPSVGGVNPWAAAVEALHVLDSEGNRVLLPELQTSVQGALPLYAALRQLLPWVPDFHQWSVDEVKEVVARVGSALDPLVLGQFRKAARCLDSPRSQYAAACV